MEEKHPLILVSHRSTANEAKPIMAQGVRTRVRKRKGPSRERGAEWKWERLPIRSNDEARADAASALAVGFEGFRRGVGRGCDLGAVQGEHLAKLRRLQRAPARLKQWLSQPFFQIGQGARHTRLGPAKTVGAFR